MQAGVAFGQGKTTELEQMLRQKELEIERLQQQLESKKSSGSSDSSVDVCAAVELGEDPSAAYAYEVGLLSLSCYPCRVVYVMLTSRLFFTGCAAALLALN